MAKDNKQVRRVRRVHALWEKQRDKAKTFWVIAVMAFWITVAVLGVVFYLRGVINLILTSIALGMLILGLWLKTRYQVILRKEPERPPISDGAADGENHHPGA